MEGLQSGAASGGAPASPSLPADAASWPELVEEQVFFVKKVVPSWDVEGVGVAPEIGDVGEIELEMEMKPDEGMESAVACEAVEFEDLFANPIEQGSNLEFRVSRVPAGASEAMDVDRAVCQVAGENEIVVLDGDENEVSEVYGTEYLENRAKEELIEIDMKAKVADTDVKEVMNVIGLLDGVREEVKLEDESDATAALNRLELQTKLVNLHVEELQRIVTLQCRLTGTNPLAQELAFAVLGTKEGWRNGHDLSTETLRYLHAVFAVKDTLTKKEARDIGVISGATLSQVREFFSTQRSRVRALVQQYTDEAEARSVEIGGEQATQIPVLVNDIGFSKLSDVDSVELLLEAMRQERNFTQQDQLLQIIIRTEPGLILRRFLEKGGLKVLCAWLINAAADEQTSVLRQLLHVLSHLPMSCAIPLQVSALLQPVNKLRFYFIQDVANHARILMSKWSKLFMNKVEGGMPVDSPGLGLPTKDSVDAPRRVKKRERDAAVTMKSYEGGVVRTKTVELVKGQSDLARVAGKTVSSVEGKKFSSGIPHGAPRSAHGKIIKPKVDLKSKTLDKESLIYNTSKLKALAAMQSNLRKIVPRKGALQSASASKPCLSNTAVVDEIINNPILDVGAQNSIYGPSSSTHLNKIKAPKARGASMADEESKGAVKTSCVMNNVKSSNTFPVSETANIATPVSRKHSLADQQKERRRVLPVDDPGNGSRWRESTARRPVIEVGKTSRPLSADEIRKAKLRARLMQQSASGTSGYRSLNTPEQVSSRGKPRPVGDGWSLDRHASMQVVDGGSKSSQLGGGVLLLRPTTSNVDVASAPRQILDDKTFDELLSEQAREAKVHGFGQAIKPRRSHTYEDSLEKRAESSSHLHDVHRSESGSGLGLGMNIEPTTSKFVNREPLPPIAVGREPLSPSIAVGREPVYPSIAGDREPVYPSIAGDREPLYPSIAADREPLSPSIAADREPLSPSIAVDGEPLSPSISSDREPLSPSIAVDREPLSPSISADREPLSPSIAVDREPLSPSIADALRGDSMELLSEEMDGISVKNDPVNISPEDPIINIASEDSLTEHATLQSDDLNATIPENVDGEGIKAHFVPWVVPSVLHLNSAWGVVAGDASKERGVQAARVRREEEVVYIGLLSIPDNPKDLWDEEPVYDDTLTPEIPVEVLEISSSKPSSPSVAVVQGVGFNPLMNGPASGAKTLGDQHGASIQTFDAAQQLEDVSTGHDPNLLALLLSNPALVSQLASQQNGENSLAGLSALLGLGLGKEENVGCRSDPIQSRVLSHPTNNSNLTAAPQPQDQIAARADFQGGQPHSTSADPFLETGAEPARIVEDMHGAIAPVPSWDVPSWAQPSPPPGPGPVIGLTVPSQESSNLPPPPSGSVPQEFGSLGPPAAAHNGSFQKLPYTPYTWAPLNTQVMHTSANQFDAPLGRGRVPVISHTVNGASGMPNVVDDASVPSAVQPPVFGQIAQYNSVGWPPHGTHPSTVVHHNVPSHAINSSARGNASNWSPHSNTSTQGYPDLHRRAPEPPPSLWARSQLPSSQPLPAPPPPYPPQYWQPQDPSFRPPPSSHPPHFRQDCRPHPPPAWHQNGSNYGPNR